ncbi:MAG: hypothetical protein F4245_06950 [Cenarchaeum sp. SB0678_bin_8]|nr:hypothetical protein [Cenarchaeum sp. SB0678_bin_8]
MIRKEEMAQIMQFISKRWEDIASNPNNRVLTSLPDTFWMNSVGGKAGKGRWVTMLMYTESEEDAEAFKEVLLRWQTKGMQKQAGPDLINIRSPRTIDE